MMEVLKSPAEWRNAWSIISSYLFEEAIKRPWRITRWKAWLQAAEYAEMENPPHGWPDDILPTSWPGW